MAVGKKQDTINITLNNEEIEKVNNYKYSCTYVLHTH